MKPRVAYAALALLIVVATASGLNSPSSPTATRSTISQSLTPPAVALERVQDALIDFPLPKGEEAYASIDGRKMHQYVVELAQIALRYRDAGHPQFWGRIIGTSSDAETSDWLAKKFRALGLADVRIQSLDLPPQWMPQAWKAEMSVAGKTITLDSAQPAYGANGLPPGGAELGAVYAGLGTEADFMGKDVRGKAVFIYDMLGLPEGSTISVPTTRAVLRAAEKGAAVIFHVSMLPGNMRFEDYPSDTRAPVFTLGNDDGTAAREMIEAASRGAAPRVRVTLAVEKVSNLKTALVWGTLPGATDETIYIIAHRDGWFEGATDNAGGVASMLGLAEYYAKLPQLKRRRTMVFIGLDGHHNGADGAVGCRWLDQHRATLFSKTALMINDEHPATIQTQSRPRYRSEDEIVWSNTYVPLQWFAGGTNYPGLRPIAWDAFKEFGVPLELNSGRPGGDLSFFSRFVPGIAGLEDHNYFHTDRDTPEVVPWTGLEAATRAFAKIIDEVNKLPLGALQQPPAVGTSSPRPAAPTTSSSSPIP
jgi:hypothetical protein